HVKAAPYSSLEGAANQYGETSPPPGSRGSGGSLSPPPGGAAKPIRRSPSSSLGFPLCAAPSPPPPWRAPPKSPPQGGHSLRRSFSSSLGSSARGNGLLLPAIAAPYARPLLLPGPALRGGAPSSSLGAAAFHFQAIGLIAGHVVLSARLSRRESGRSAQALVACCHAFVSDRQTQAAVLSGNPCRAWSLRSDLA